MSAFLSFLAGSFDESPAFALVDTVATERAHARACPSRDIERFVSAFAEDVSLQKLFTAEIVETAFVDDAAEPEPVEIVRPVPRDRLRFPLMPNRAQQNEEGLSYRLVSIDAVRAIIALSVQDTDWQLVYTFRRDRCWTLVKITDPAFGKPLSSLGTTAPSAENPRLSGVKVHRSRFKAPPWSHQKRFHA